MTAFFAPKREDGRSLRQVGFDYLTDEMESGRLKSGDVIKHADLAAAMDVTYPSSSYFQTAGKVTVMLQKNFHRSLVPVRGEGYRLVEGLAQVDKGRSEIERGRRNVSKAIATVQAVDELTLGTPGERVTLTQVRQGFAVIGAVIGQQAEKLAELDDEVILLKRARMDDRERVAAIEAQVAAIAEKMAG